MSNNLQYAYGISPLCYNVDKILSENKFCCKTLTITKAMAPLIVGFKGFKYYEGVDIMKHRKHKTKDEYKKYIHKRDLFLNRLFVSSIFIMLFYIIFAATTVGELSKRHNKQLMELNREIQGDNHNDFSYSDSEMFLKPQLQNILKQQNKNNGDFKYAERK